MAERMCGTNNDRLNGNHTITGFVLGDDQLGFAAAFKLAAQLVHHLDFDGVNRIHLDVVDLAQFEARDVLFLQEPAAFGATDLPGNQKSSDRVGAAPNGKAVMAMLAGRPILGKPRGTKRRSVRPGRAPVHREILGIAAGAQVRLALVRFEQVGLYPMLGGIGQRGFLAVELQPDLCLGIAGRCPAH
jgi:hypothetical protein